MRFELILEEDETETNVKVCIVRDKYTYLLCYDFMPEAAFFT